MKSLFFALLLALIGCQPAIADSGNVGIYASAQVSSIGGSCSGLNGFTHCRSITINSSLVAATQSEFPVLVSGTYSYLATTANSGFIQHTTTLHSQTVPADLVYTSDSACTALLNWEVESYNATTGAINVWVNTPISSSSNTVIYECYGKSSITTYQATATSVWDSNYVAVYHYPNGSTLSIADSTVNNTTTTLNGTTNPTAVAGYLDGGMQTYGSGGSGTQNGSGIILPGSTIGAAAPFSISGWVYPSSAAQVAIFGSSQSLGDLEIRFSSTLQVQVLKNNIALFVTSTATATASQWNFVAVAVDSSNNINININGTNQVFSGAYNNTPNNGINTIGYNTWADTGLVGYIDETELSNSFRSANWIQTEYNNQSSPGTFYTVGSQS